MANLWLWTTAGAKICPDCGMRHGETGTLDYWESVGMPGDGMTYCLDDCKCLLMRTELLERIAGLPSGSSATAILDALGMRTPVLAMSGALQADLYSAGLSSIAELSYIDAQAELVDKILEIEAIPNLNLMSLEALLDIYERLVF